MSDEEDRWYVYLVECADGSLYTGITKDLERRLIAHNEGRGAKYTRGRAPVVLLGREGPMPRPDALRRELAVKRMAPELKRATMSSD